MGKKFREWAIKGSFRSKLLVTSIACLLIPTLITLSVSNVLMRDAVKAQAMSNAEGQLKLVDGYISNLFAYMLYISNYIIVEPNINAILKRQAAGLNYTGDNAEYREFEDRNEIMSKIDNISIIGEKTYITILLPNDRYYMNYQNQEYDPRLLFKEPWFKALDELTGMEAYWVESEPSPFLYERAAGRHQITVARTLRRPNMEIYAYVIVTVPDNQINEIFEQVATDQEIMLVDGNNRIMSSLDTNRIGQNLSDFLENDKESLIAEFNGEDYLVAQRDLPVKDWKLVLLTPYKDAVYKINNIFQSVFIIQIIAFSVFLVLLIFLIRTFTKPLVRLGKLAHTVQRGNLDVRSNIQGHDEIGHLGSSFDQMLDRIKHMVSEIKVEQSRKRKAELAMLQAQINPHFLFNVLNSIRMKVLRKGDKESAEMLSSLSRILRLTIGRQEESITLHDEVSTAIDYVNLMNMRQKEKVQLYVNVSSEVMMAQVPRFILQPIIENALIHGLHQSSGVISVSAHQVEPKMLEIVVRDDGVGMKSESLQQLRLSLMSESISKAETGEQGARFSGIGLANVSERMRIRFGKEFSMNIDSEEGRGTLITMRVPMQEASDTHV